MDALFKSLKCKCGNLIDYWGHSWAYNPCETCLNRDFKEEGISKKDTSQWLLKFKKENINNAYIVLIRGF